jgi:uncharacterized membrane protein YfcA
MQTILQYSKIALVALGTCLHAISEAHVTPNVTSNVGSHDFRAQHGVANFLEMKSLQPGWPSPERFIHQATKPTEGRITVDEAKPMGWWGFPKYFGALKSWPQLQKEQGMLGGMCQSSKSKQQCGIDFVCRNNVCSECVETKECLEKHKCIYQAALARSICIPRDLRSHWNHWEVIATILIILTAMLSAAAGMGGGGVYVPLLLLLMGLSTKEAVPLSQAMICGGAIVNVVMFCGERHPKYPARPKIDYEVIMMMNPGLAAGVTIGVISHIVSPQWLIISVLVVTLAISLQKSATKGIQQWNKESAAIAASQASGNSGSGGSSGSGSIKIKGVDLASFRELVKTNTIPMMLILGCWLAFLMMNLLKQDNCSMMYWLHKLAMLAICAVFTLGGARTIMNRETSTQQEGILEWTSQTLLLYPVYAAVAGFLGGFLGIGGGIIMGPLLLELGMVPEANQATTAMFVFLSSTLATMQFVLAGAAMPQYVMWFTAWVFGATFVGQTLVDYLLRKYKRSSIIVLSIAGIIAGSLVMMTIVGGIDIYKDLRDGRYMGFVAHKLCGA